MPLRFTSRFHALEVSRRSIHLPIHPGVSYTAFAQSHPFSMAWWYRDMDDTDVVVIIVQPRRVFTRAPHRHSADHLGTSAAMRAAIDGPYGTELRLESFGTVLLFATDVGIAGQLPYVKQLLDGYHNCQIKTRRIALFWEVRLECEYSPSWKIDDC